MPSCLRNTCMTFRSYNVEQLTRMAPNNWYINFTFPANNINSYRLQVHVHSDTFMYMCRFCHHVCYRNRIISYIKHLCSKYLHCSLVLCTVLWYYFHISRCSKYTVNGSILSLTFKLNCHLVLLNTLSDKYDQITMQCLGAKLPIQSRHMWAERKHSDHLYWLRPAQSVA